MKYTWPSGVVEFVQADGFSIATTPVTQALWLHVMGPPNPAINQTSPEHPLENVSWDSLHARGGFLERINAAPIREALDPSMRFRLPTEAEWDYAARGGTHSSDGFIYSGSNDIGAVAWYDRKHGDHTQPVKLKAPNQLGIYDMCGNVWEWCEDLYTGNGSEKERVLRGGCFHNWAVHCTVSKRYAIDSDAHDGCIGFRLVLS
ncbi:MAG: formylglycine-generating enzyme family protein [Acidobacteria bacterium]|nr:formylglycine-generating enzyme family protein [Acidobacteriota bacterium]